MESHFEIVELPQNRDALAPDGSDVRLLVAGAGGSMAHFALAAGEISVAIAHRTIEELWFVLSGHGEMWLRPEDDVDGNPGTVLAVRQGTSLKIPKRTHFQFRCVGSEPLTAVGVTMPRWPGGGDLSGKGEAYPVDGPWPATVESGTEWD